jgi:hypothetical protein
MIIFVVIPSTFCYLAMEHGQIHTSKFKIDLVYIWSSFSFAFIVVEKNRQQNFSSPYSIILDRAARITVSYGWSDVASLIDCCNKVFPPDWTSLVSDDLLILQCTCESGCTRHSPRFVSITQKCHNKVNKADPDRLITSATFFVGRALWME